VVWHFRHRVLDLAVHVARPPERDFIAKLFIAFLPAAAIGFFAHDYITTYLFNPVTVAWALIVGGFVMLLIEAWYAKQTPRVEDTDRVSYGDALKVGIAQTLALFPGVSRAGATIMGGLLTGLSRQAATEFSFFLAMPTMLAATSYDLLKSFDVLQPSDAATFAVGFVTAFVTALVVVRVFLGFVARYTFKVFAWYRIAFGALVLLYFWLRS
jgi:undecaprenyl-diphosphatase